MAASMATSAPAATYPQDYEKKVRMCRFFLGPKGCRDGTECLYQHVDDRPTCKYYFSKWGCWNGRWCRFSHSEPQEEEQNKEVDMAKQFYKELNQWLGPSRTPDESVMSVVEPGTPTTPTPGGGASMIVAEHAYAAKKFVSRGTQTKNTPDFINCGECGEEFKSGRTLQQSLERHYIHKLASADFHHLRFFKRHATLQRDDPFCAACGEVFGTIEGLLQHMGSNIAFTTISTSVRHEHQSWFKQLVQPFVYRDLEVLETDEDMVQRIMEIYFVKPYATSGSTKLSAATEASKKQQQQQLQVAPKTKQASPKISPMKLARKLQKDVNNNTNKSSPFLHCVECGEIFDNPESDEKLREHYAEMLMRADGRHVKPLRRWSNAQAHCNVCEKTFLSTVALLQHLGSKVKVTMSNNRQSASTHTQILYDIAEIFVGRDLGVEGYIDESALSERLHEVISPGSSFCHPNEVPDSEEDSPAAVDSVPRSDDGQRDTTTTMVKSANKSDKPQQQEYVDEALQMARYFCRVNEWQAKMSYPDYVKDDQERTRNNGFTVAEVDYLASKGLEPTSRGVFNVLNALYRRRRNPLRKFVPRDRNQPTASAKAAENSSKTATEDSKYEKVGKTSTEKASEGGATGGEPSMKSVDKEDEWETIDDQQVVDDKNPAPKAKRKKRVRRRRRSKVGLTADLEGEDEPDLDEHGGGSPKKAGSSPKKSSPKKSPKKSLPKSSRGPSQMKTQNDSSTSASRKRARILSRDIDSTEKPSKVFFQVHIDGTVFVREKFANAEEEVIDEGIKDDSLIQRAVDESLHTAKEDISITSRVFVGHEDGLIDIILKVAGISLDISNSEDITASASSTSASPGNLTTAVSKLQSVDKPDSSPEKAAQDGDSAIVDCKVSAEALKNTKILKHMMSAESKAQSINEKVEVPPVATEEEVVATEETEPPGQTVSGADVPVPESQATTGTDQNDKRSTEATSPSQTEVASIKTEEDEIPAQATEIAEGHTDLNPDPKEDPNPDPKEDPKEDPIPDPKEVSNSDLKKDLNPDAKEVPNPDLKKDLNPDAKEVPKLDPKEDVNANPTEENTKPTDRNANPTDEFPIQEKVAPEDDNNNTPATCLV